MNDQAIKKRLLQLTIAAGLVATAAAIRGSVTTSSEVWVGSSSPIQGNGGAGSKVSFFAQRMVLPVETAGIISALQGAVLNDTNCTWSEGQFGTRGVPAYVEFDNGWMADIADCSVANKSLTLAAGLGAAISPGNAYRIHKHFTVASMFGANNETGLMSGLNPSTADNILLLVPQTQQLITIFYYDDGTTRGWMDATFARADNYVIYPEQGLMVRRRLAAPVNLYLAGPVKTGPTIVTVDVGNNLVGTLKSAAALTVPSLNLYTGDPTTGLASGLNPSASDNLLVVAPDGATATYFYYKDPTYEGWLDAAFNPAGAVPINPGSAFFIRRRLPNAAFNWTIPAE